MVSQGGLGFHEGLDTVDHVLDKLLLRFTESSLVGDIENSVVGLSMLTMDTSDLDLVFVGNLVEGFFIVHQLWQLDVDRSSHGSTKVGWARGNVTEMLVVGELDDSFNMLSSSAKSLEDSSDVSTWLHGNDTKLILLVNPHEESLLLVVEDTSARWPVPVETARLEEFVSLPNKSKKIFRYNYLVRQTNLMQGLKNTYLKRK